MHECRARGRFRLDKITPLVGDVVDFSGQSDETHGFIEEIHERKNVLVRPPVANIDNLVIVLSASKPEPDLLLVDKLILHAEINNIMPVLCLNKIDAVKKPETAEDYREQYSCYPFSVVSASNNTGLGSLEEILKGKTSAFTGQSAVGKSSILNVLGADLQLKTDGLSKKTSRGKHTTRQSELMYLNYLDAFVIDTPGFSIFDSIDLDETALASYYREFLPYAGKCRFLSCLHANEPECAVKDAARAGNIHPKRYERYLEILNLLKEKRSKKYD